jgi:uncharacterized protein YndB with AHSA1/START domain
MQRTEKLIEIDAPVERVFDLFSDFENFPRWMNNIKDVHYTGRRFTRWTARAPFGTSVEWEAETTVFEPDHRIAWRTVRGDVNTDGEVIFETTKRGTTLLRVMLGYEVPAGRLGSLVASLFGKNPEQELEEDLRHFAEIVEGRIESQRGRAPYEDKRNEDARNFRRRNEDEAPSRRREEVEPSKQRRAFIERADEIHEEEKRWRDQARRRETVSGRHALTPRERAREREIERERRLNNIDEESKKVFRRGVDKLSNERPSNRSRR